MALFLVLASILMAFSIAASGQGAASTFDDTIEGAAGQRKVYIEEFKNLMSQEIKTFEIYDKTGAVKKNRSVVSTFIVYQLSKGDKGIVEYRNVVAVDGKKLDDSEKRAQDFFDDIVKVDSSAKELEKLAKEGARYDEGISVNGLTLYQSVSIADNMRPYFEFKLDGEERLGGRKVFAISYQQTKLSPYISTDPREAARDGKLNLIFNLDFDGSRNVNGRLRGEFWIDAVTLQVWKELRVLTIQPEGFESPILFAENTFEYQPSEFGILTPKRITYTQFRIDKKTRESRKDVSVAFDYVKFTKPDVEVKSAEVKN